jgi:ribose-phosphate pyrophosphokinase
MQILITNGLKRFDEAYKEVLIYRIITTNLVYQTDELLSRPYYISADMSKYIAILIDTLNHDQSISELLDPTDRIRKILKKYKKGSNL